MQAYIISLKDADKTMVDMVGGKGANLGELARIGGILVPDGFCITTKVYTRIVNENASIKLLLDQLLQINAADKQAINGLSHALHAAIEQVAIPEDIHQEIMQHLAGYGAQTAWAVRSSATAEDLANASFAGQHETYLNIVGTDAILQHIRLCWASLFTERAIIYRIRHGFDHRQVQLAVVVQQMVFPQVAGILFTADPVSGNRKVLSIDASFGLGEALVSGLVNADNYKVRNGKVIEQKIATKKLAIYAAKDGGIHESAIAADQQHISALTEEQILQLERIGRKIEAHFGQPQDIEWCLADGVVYIVQSRPVTTLYPIPVTNDNELHIFISVGHQQMMTDAMKPLGLSVWQLTAGRPMYEAGGRIFVDVARELAAPASRHMLINVLGKSDPLIRDALTTIIERGDLISSVPSANPSANDAQAAADSHQQKPPADYQALNDYDPSVVNELISSRKEYRRALEQKIHTLSGDNVFECILEDVQQARSRADQQQSFAVIMTAMNAAHWLNDHMLEWLGEKNAADTLTQSVPNNITSEMGLALLDVADVVRPFPEVIAFMQQTKDRHFMDELVKYKGGQVVKEAMEAYLNKYGMRCAGEIDITRSRWSEDPAILIPMILGYVKQFEPGESRRKFEQGKQQAIQKEQDLLEGLSRLQDGDQKAKETQRMTGLVRSLSGYREYPKYDIISRYYFYKQALLKEAMQLVQAGVIRQTEDVFYLRFEEFREVVRTQQADYRLIEQRNEAYRSYEQLKPPRVLTSEGEVISGSYKRENIPAGAIVGLPVSSGTIEGRARVILNMQEADLEEGDILVTSFTDPSWTPLFISIKGLVTEVGGLMTHGAVIAREYGLPAVVGVENATRLIKDGQRIRVHGTEGYIEVL